MRAEAEPVSESQWLSLRWMAASRLAVALALTLLLSLTPTPRGLGVASAVGIVVAAGLYAFGRERALIQQRRRELART